VSGEVVEGLARLYLEGAGRPLVLLHGVEDPLPTRRSRLEDQIGRDLEALLHMSDVRPALIARVVGGVLYEVAHDASRPGGRQASASPYPATPVLVSELIELMVGYLGGAVRPVAVPIALLEPAPVASVPVARPTPKPVVPVPRPPVELVHTAVEEQVEEAEEQVEELLEPVEELLEPVEELPELVEAVGEPEAPEETIAAQAPPEEPAPEPAPEPPHERPTPPKPAEPNPFDVWG
jgi:hypothetical protein